MPFSISADFLLGTYQGHDKNGRAEAYPNLVRLQAAFVSAAYSLNQYENGSAGESRIDDSLDLPVDMSAAIRWFEGNPPSAISLPTSMRNETSDISAYRNKGLIICKEGIMSPKIAEEPALSRSVLAGPVVWWWKEAPSSEVQKTLARLSCEIPYLGESASPVIIRVKNEKNIPKNVWTIVEGFGLKYLGYPSFAVPAPGRADALQAAFTEQVGKKIPSVASDKYSTSEMEITDTWLDHFIDAVIYRDAHEDDENIGIPWNFGYVLTIDKDSSECAKWPPAEDEYVEWSVAVHRALTSKCGNDVPRILSGKGTKSAMAIAQLPANGVSIQLIDEALPLADSAMIQGSAFLIMVPTGADVEDIEAVDRAVHTLSRVYESHLGVVQIASVREVQLSHFWKDPQPGFKRWWQPLPLYVADNRPPYKNSGKRVPWTLSDSIKVSIGYVWRDVLKPMQSGGKRMLELNQAVTEQDVIIAGARQVRAARSSKYAYHMNNGSFFSAATALIDLGKLSTECAAVAIGQTRHMGGGLLVPIDFPDDSMKSTLHQSGGEK